MIDDVGRFAHAKAATQDIYERHANHWHAQRSKILYQRIWLDRFIQALPPKSRVLDLGCGTGDPVAKYMIQNGFILVGVDYSSAMIEKAQRLFPAALWQVGDMRALDDIGLFDGIYSWDGFFHLSVSEQGTLLPELAARVRSGGTLMLTVGPDEGEATGTIGCETVYHASLSPAEYELILRENGFGAISFKAEDPDCQGRTVVMASQKTLSAHC